METLAIDSEETLREAILRLEEQQRQETQNVKAAFHELSESIKPANLIRNSIEEATDGDDDKGSLFTALGMGAGFLARRVVTGGTPNIARKLLGTAVQFGIYNLITKNPKVRDTIASFLTKMTGGEEKKK